MAMYAAPGLEFRQVRVKLYGRFSNDPAPDINERGFEPLRAEIQAPKQCGGW